MAVSESEFLGLEPLRYDFQAARNLPVRGSSAFGRDKGEVHWKAVAKDASFEPKERWRSWHRAQVERFEWLAGDQLVAFDYTASRRRFSIGASIKHTLFDWRWRAWTASRRFLYSTRVRLALRSRIAGTLKALRIGPAAR